MKKLLIAMALPTMIATTPLFGEEKASSCILRFLSGDTETTNTFLLSSDAELSLNLPMGLEQQLVLDVNSTEDGRTLQVSKEITTHGKSGMGKILLGATKFFGSQAYLALLGQSDDFFLQVKCEPQN